MTASEDIREMRLADTRHAEKRNALVLPSPELIDVQVHPLLASTQLDGIAA